MEHPEPENPENVVSTSSSQQSETAPAPVVRSVSSSRTCWVCFATDEDDNLAKWLTPCRCKGSIRYVHESCLERWIDEKQKGNMFGQVTCTQCNTKYIIVYPALNKLTLLLAHFNTYVNRAAPFMAGGILLGGLYWVSVTFGAITLMQMFGYKRAMGLFSHTEPMLLLVGLPTIPVLLMSAGLIHCDDRLAYSLYLRSSAARRARKAGKPLAQSPNRRLSDGVASSRLMCLSLALPTFSCIVGRWVFSELYPQWSTIRRNVAGALTYWSVKGLFNVYYRYAQLCQKHDRQVLNFPEEMNQSTQTQAALDVNIQDDREQDEEEEH